MPTTTTTTFTIRVCSGFLHMGVGVMVGDTCARACNPHFFSSWLGVVVCAVTVVVAQVPVCFPTWCGGCIFYQFCYTDI
jgi:hypothetical protein